MAPKRKKQNKIQVMITSDMWRPAAERVPSAAEAGPMTDALAFDGVKLLMQERVGAALALEMGEFKNNPHNKRPGLVVMSPSDRMLGIVAGIGMAAACNERHAVGELLHYFVQPLVELAQRVTADESIHARALALGVQALQNEFARHLMTYRGPVSRRDEVIGVVRRDETNEKSSVDLEFAVAR